MSSRKVNDVIAREMVAKEMFDRICDRRYGDLYPTEPRDVLTAGIEAAASYCARYLTSGNLGLAHAHARVHAELQASMRRMYARWAARREAAAKAVAG